MYWSNNKTTNSLWLLFKVCNIYIAEKQLGDKKNLYNVSFNDKILRNLVETSNKMFLNLKRKGSILEKEIKYFAYDYENASNLGKF